MSDMDRGEFIRNGYTIEPGQGGSFVAIQGGANWHRDGIRLSATRGFTNFEDLLRWLGEEHRVNAEYARDQKAPPEPR